MAWILPSSIVAFLWVAFLDRDGGTLRRILDTPDTAWLLEHPMASIIVFNTWRGTAFSMLLFSAALGAVPPSQLETARLAGAGDVAAVPRRRVPAHPRARPHQHAAHQPLDLQRLRAVPAHRRRTGPRDRDAAGLHLQRARSTAAQLGYGSAISFIMLLINLVIALFYIRLLRERRTANRSMDADDAVEPTVRRRGPTSGVR